MEKICITGMGMVTSLGLDAQTCCAAARAGIVRATELDSFYVRDPEDGSISGLVVHAAPMITEGFEGDARLLRLTTAALVDLQKQTSHEPWKQGKTGFYFSVPELWQEFTGSALIADEEERKLKKQDEEEIKTLPEPPNELRARDLLKTSAHIGKWPGKIEFRFTAASGNTGVTEALNKAIEELLSGVINVAIVGGVDSLLGENTLNWLTDTGRLKTLEMATGLQPGEASAFIVLETLRGANSRGGKAMAVVDRICIGAESRPLLSGNRSFGEGVATLIDQAMAGNDRMAGQPPWVITDQNGESYRAVEWGNALVRLVKERPEMGDAVLTYPAMSFGDTGAATGAVSACMVAKAFERGYAATANAVILSSALGAARSLLVLSCQ